MQYVLCTWTPWTWDLKRLACYKTHLRDLANKKVLRKRKKQRLNQKGGNLLSAVLPLVLSVLGSLLVWSMQNEWYWSRRMCLIVMSRNKRLRPPQLHLIWCIRIRQCQRFFRVQIYPVLTNCLPVNSEGKLKLRFVHSQKSHRPVASCWFYRLVASCQ